jgi:uncharacterized phage infection (PIP) family protein YhgE
MNLTELDEYRDNWLKLDQKVKAAFDNLRNEKIQAKQVSILKNLTQLIHENNLARDKYFEAVSKWIKGD